jgi:cysteine-S-conjugate beta-lyase
VLAYLTANRDLVVDYVRQHMPGITVDEPEATYLAWLDCRSAGIPGNPFKFFLKEAKVVLSDGGIFGRPGEGFLRLNFGCPRSLLETGLAAMAEALSRQAAGVAPAD